MDDILVLQAVERYLKEEMTAEEKAFFEDLRKSNPEIDQLVVEQSFLMNELDKYGNTRNFKHAMHEVQGTLTEEGLLNKSALKGRAKIAYIWKRYKRIAAVAASIASIVSITIVIAASVYNNNKSNKEIILLGNEVKSLKEGQTATNKELKEVKSK